MDSGNLATSVLMGLEAHFWSLKNTGNHVVSMQCAFWGIIFFFWGIIYLLFSLSGFSEFFWNFHLSQLC